MQTETIVRLLQDYAERNGQDIQWRDGYSEPGYDTPEHGVCLGDWNSRTVTRRVYEKPLPDFLSIQDPNATYQEEDQTMPRIAAILEKLGVGIEWEDEWAECPNCQRIVRTSPDSYGWTRSYWQSDCDIICQDCLKSDPSEYLEDLEGDHQKANTLSIDLEDHGYRKVDLDFESGLYGGQCDDPETVAESLRKMGIERFIFEVNSVGQFDLDFSVWVHNDQWQSELECNIESAGADPAVAMKSALKSTSVQMSQFSGPGVRVARCHSDGTATVKMVSRKDFIDGNALN